MLNRRSRLPEKRIPGLKSCQRTCCQALERSRLFAICPDKSRSARRRLQAALADVDVVGTCNGQDDFLICCMPISASPLATTSATGTPWTTLRIVRADGEPEPVETLAQRKMTDELGFVLQLLGDAEPFHQLRCDDAARASRLVVYPSGPAGEHVCSAPGSDQVAAQQDFVASCQKRRSAVR
jgi:hypothetical protein